MRLLGNLVVRKYFGCQAVCTEAHFLNMGYDEHERCMSYRILDAMQEPIKKGERYLYVEREDHCYMTNTTEDAEAITGFHPNRLRLLDRFQPSQTKECDHRETKCMTCGVEFPVPTPTPPLVTCAICGHIGPKIHEGQQSHSCVGRLVEQHEPAKDDVEEKIKEVIHEFKWSGTTIARKLEALRELVRLARKNA